MQGLILRSRSVAAFAGSCALLGMPAMAAAQATASSAITVRVLDIGAVLDVSALQVEEREPGGDLHVAGTVTIRQNGPFLLQVRLAEPFVDPGNGKRTITSDVLAVIGNALVPVGLDDWVTLTTGPGTSRTTVPVEYLIRWGKGASKDPADAVSAPLTYRVVSAGAGG